MTFVEDRDFRLFHGGAVDVVRFLEPGSVDAVVTSPPYLDTREDSPAFTEWPALFDGLAAALKRAGPIALNIGRLWRSGVELRWWEPILEAAGGAGFHLLDTLVWIKPNANPIKGRVALADSHEYVFLLGEPGRTLFNVDELRTPYSDETIARMGRRWTSGSVKNGPDRNLDGLALNDAGARPRSFAVHYVGGEKGNPHPTPMPSSFARELVALVSWSGETVLDPFLGSGTTALACRETGRLSVGIELDVERCQWSADRMSQLSLLAELEAPA